MKRFAWILLIFALGMIALLTSCKVHDARYRMHDARYTMHDIARDSIREYVRDSMAVRVVAGKPGEHGGLGCAPDTVYIDRWHTSYRDRWRTLSHTDTVVITQRDSIPYPVEVPIEVAKPVPRVYRYCFWLVIMFILLGLIRIVKAVYLYR